MKNANLVADELKNSGFQTKVIVSNGVKVSLSNRKPSKMEVETALEQIFDSIQFQVIGVPDGVLVTW